MEHVEQCGSGAIFSCFSLVFPLIFVFFSLFAGELFELLKIDKVHVLVYADRMFYDYSSTALDIALQARRVIAGQCSMQDLDHVLVGVEELLKRNADMRMVEHRIKTGVTSRPLEEETQALLVSILRQDPLSWSPGGVGIVGVHHSPLGYYRTKYQRMSAKRAGAGSGWPDLDIRLVGCTGPVSLLLELKAGSGRASMQQVGMIENLRSAGFSDVFVVRGLDQALKKVLEYLIPVPF